MSNNFSVAIIVCNYAKACSPAITNTMALQVIVVWLTKETADGLYGQFSPAVVVKKSFIVRWPAFSGFSAARIMDIHTKGQSQTQELCTFQVHPPFNHPASFSPP